MRRVCTRPSTLRLSRVLLAACALSLSAPAPSDGATVETPTQFSVNPGLLTFLTEPSVPTLGPVTLNGRAQTINATMNDFIVLDGTGTGAGWNVTVEGQSGAGRSAVFAQYCPKAKCGADSEGYVSGGQSLPANSLTLNSTGAGFIPGLGGTGLTPALECATSCNVDGISPEKIASAAVEAGLGTWLTTGFSTSSVALAVPTTMRALPGGEVYRVNLLWTLSVGP